MRLKYRDELNLSPSSINALKNADSDVTYCLTLFKGIYIYIYIVNEINTLNIIHQYRNKLSVYTYPLHLFV